MEKNNKPDYRALCVDRELGITDVNQLSIGNIVTLKFKNKYYIHAVSGLSRDYVYLTRVKKLSQLGMFNGMTAIPVKGMHKVLYPLELTDEFFERLGFENVKTEKGLTDDIIVCELKYTHPDNVYTITATRYNPNRVVSNGYRIHVDDCDMDTICAVGEMKHWHSLKNFLTANGIQLFDYEFEEEK